VSMSCIAGPVMSASRASNAQLAERFIEQPRRKNRGGRWDRCNFHATLDLNRIRPDVKTDFAITRLVDDTRVEELHRLVIGAFRKLSIDPPSGVLKETVADFRERLKSEIALVAEAEGALVGSVFCAHKTSSLYVGRLAVRDDFRRLGIASALLEAAKEEARLRATPKLTLATRIALTSNIALFSKHGFVVVAERSHAGYSHPTSYDMELDLG
jgi:ribosomal protein S18 acetylase RimI-like enzyme